MINQYRVKTPISVAGVIGVGGNYADGTVHVVRVWAYADIPNVGRVFSSSYAQSAVLNVDADNSSITWTAVIEPIYGNEPQYVNPTGYIFLKYSEACGFDYTSYRSEVLPETLDEDCGDWTANPSVGYPANQQLSPVTFVVTPQADIPRANPLSTNLMLSVIAQNIKQ